MNIKRILKDVLVAFSAQGVALVTSVFTSLLVPKLLNVTEFGYWQLFLFYSNYTGFFHLGLNDGVYLISGGQTRGEIDKSSVTSQFRLGTLFQSIVAVVITCLAFALSDDSNRLYVFVCISIFLVLKNAADYLGMTLQAMVETRRYSISVMIDRAMFLLLMAALVITGIQQFEWYVAAYVLSKFVSLSYCVIVMRDVLTFPGLPLDVTAKKMLNSVKAGFGLMLANIASGLILGVVQFCVDARWGIEVFGVASMAISLANVFLVFVSQASMVLFPNLRQGTFEERRSFYITMKNGLGVVLPVVFLFYYPASFIVSSWLPQYAASIPYFAMLLPLCIFDGKMDLCCTTYFKVLRMERVLLVVNLAALALSFCFVALSVFVLSSIEMALICAVLAIVLRSTVSELIINRCYDVRFSFTTVLEVGLSLVFMFSALRFDPLPSFGIVAIAYIIYLGFNKTFVVELWTRVKGFFA